MLLSNECFCATRNLSLLLNANKLKKVRRIPHRLIFKWGSRKTEDSKSVDNRAEEPELKPLKGVDDESFSDHIKSGRVFDPYVQKEGFRKLMLECKRFCKEEFEEHKFRDFSNIEINDDRTKVRMLYTFEKEEDLKNFNVFTDSTYQKGYSSASFKLTENGTGIFSGNVCTDVPKTGDICIAGYANLHCPKQTRAFFRVKPYDWGNYTHLVFKIRGDGRTYLVLMHLPNVFKESYHEQYALPLYTRGGPYWQIAKLPFSHFYYSRAGKVGDHQNDRIPLHDIVNISITVGGYEGPFKLEIDYIGLEFDESHKTYSPYEQYKVKI